jgi:uncharacterized membrane protein
MKTKASEIKSSHILIILIVAGLISLAGLVIDAGKVYLDRREAQDAADSAAQAAALALAQGQDVTSAAQLRAASNGYDNDGTKHQVMVNNPPSMGCNGKYGSQAGNAKYIQVIIQSNVNTYFAQVVGIREAHNCVEAIYETKPITYSLLD